MEGRALAEFVNTNRELTRFIADVYLMFKSGKLCDFSWIRISASSYRVVLSVPRAIRAITINHLPFWEQPDSEGTPAFDSLLGTRPWPNLYFSQYSPSPYLHMSRGNVVDDNARFPEGGWDIAISQL